MSSARVVRRMVKSLNERNPCPVLLISLETVTDNVEEGGDDVKSAWLLRLGLHTCYNGRYKEPRNRKMELISTKPVSVRIEV